QDMQEAPAPDLPQEHGVVVTAPVWRPSRVQPYEEDLHSAAELLNSGERIALLVGQGARQARDEVIAVAERLGAGITTSLRVNAYVHESLSFVFGTMGHLGSTASAQLLGEATPFSSSDPTIRGPSS